MNTQIHEFTQHMINQNNEQRKQFTIPFPEVPKQQEETQSNSNQQEEPNSSVTNQNQTQSNEQPKSIKKFTFKKK